MPWPVQDNDFMEVTRRSLAQMLAMAAAGGRASAQAPESNPDLEQAREQMRGNAQQIAKIKLPRATEPACHFKA